MGPHIDERPDGGFALYIDGDFQFDTSDEAIYHESLALPALCMARNSGVKDVRVLICGGGDGLALRECLRFPDVVSVDLVDYDPDIVTLGRTRFVSINQGAFEDARVSVHFGDAWDFLLPPSGDVPAESVAEYRESQGRYDVIICDFTVPRSPEQARIFTREWYERLSGRLTSEGIIALNTVSPQTTPEAFWCLRRTIKAAGMSVLPYRVCIPSFRAHGYGAWAFMLAANRPLRQHDLRTLDCPIPARQANPSELWRGASFRRSERRIERRMPVHSLTNNCLLPLLLNPGMAVEAAGNSLEASPFSLDPLMEAIPITHPYHTRVMIETLAEQVAATVTQIDVRRLVDALLRRAARLPAALRDELIRLRRFLTETTINWSRFLAWSARLFAALVVLMTIANAIAPDNAFAKGSAGLGHSGVSRGYSGSFGGAGRASGGSARSGSSFGTGRSASGGSFGRTGAFGSRSLFSSSSAPTMRSGGFRTGYGSGRPIDMYGTEYNIMPFHYYYGGGHTYFGSGQAAPPSGPQVEHKPLFAADDDMLVMDNGDVVVTLSEHAYLLVTGGKVVLRSDKSPDSLLALYADPALFQGILGQLNDRQAALQEAISVRKDWLSWVGWTSVLLPTVAQDRTELSHMEDLDKRLQEAVKRLGQPPAGAAPAPALRNDQVDLFVNARLEPDGRVSLRQEDGSWVFTDGALLTPTATVGTAGRSVPCPPELAAALHSVMVKLKKEMAADVASNKSDLSQLNSDMYSLKADLKEYENLQSSHDPGYQVDYGTDEIAVSDAIRKTQADIDQTNKDIQENNTESTKLERDQSRLAAANPALRP